MEEKRRGKNWMGSGGAEEVEGMDRGVPVRVPRSRTSTSQQCAFASAGPLLWNCLPVKTRAQILSSSLSSTPRLLKSFLFPGAYRTGGRL